MQSSLMDVRCCGGFIGLLLVLIISTSRTVKKLHEYLNHCCVYLIFDRYPAKSTKSATRSNRAGANVSRRHVLSLHTTLPAQKVVINITYNKTQLITLITNYLVDHLEDRQNELVITSDDPVPAAIRNGEDARRSYMICVTFMGRLM